MPALVSSPYVTVNGTFITLHCSDGASSRRPNKDMSALVKEDGTVDYMQECTGDDPALNYWKGKIGTFLAEAVLGLPEAKGRKYILSRLPQGYRLFLHKKGDRLNPRTDAYLRGSTNVHSFRSPAEFFFHAKWLLLGCPKPDPFAPRDLDEELFGPPLPEDYTDRCGCKYCAGVDQTYISTHFSNYSPGQRKGQRTGQKEIKTTKDIFAARFEGMPSQRG